MHFCDLLPTWADFRKKKLFSAGPNQRTRKSGHILCLMATCQDWDRGDTMWGTWRLPWGGFPESGLPLWYLRVPQKLGSEEKTASPPVSAGNSRARVARLVSVVSLPVQCWPSPRPPPDGAARYFTLPGGNQLYLTDTFLWRLTWKCSVQLFPRQIHWSLTWILCQEECELWKGVCVLKLLFFTPGNASWRILQVFVVWLPECSKFSQFRKLLQLTFSIQVS